jgi:hypothetical protein
MSSLETFQSRIEIPGDVLVPDEVFCDEALGGLTTRTARKFDPLGLPFVMISNRKYRPLNEGRKWLAARIQRKGQPPVRRRRA